MLDFLNALNGVPPGAFQAATAGFSALASLFVAFNTFLTARNRRAIASLHDCLDEHRAEVSAALSSAVVIRASDQRETASRLDTIEKKQNER